jgi:hypothetical protein
MSCLNHVGYATYSWNYSHVTKATLVYCDNISAVYLSDNPVQHQHTKHIEMDIHFVREKVARGQVRVLHIPSRFQIVDIFTKGLPLQLFDDFRDSFNICSPPFLTTGVYYICKYEKMIMSIDCKLLIES